jgi:AAA15 family ATPase/GTPase
MYIDIFKVIIDHFRGYREPKTFDFEMDTDVIILSGSNGYGKTSVFDAIEWGFTGKLYRFEEPNEEKSNTCFINYQPFEQVGKVVIEFGDKNDRYILTRTSLFTVLDSTDYNVKKSSLCLESNCIGKIYNDDPIQNMDDLNVIAFIDILRNYLDTDNNSQTKKQIIISTHDQDFYKIMVKKFRFINKKSFEFIGYSEIGPVVM